MAISKNDCLLLLSELKDRGIDTTSKSVELMKMADPSIDIIRYINHNRQLDLGKFYEKIRKSYNNKKSSLYINIVKEIDDPNDVLTTLSALETQILLFSKNVENKQMFLRHSRAEEISIVLTNYFRTFDIAPCLKLLHLIKVDVKCMEYVNGRNI